MRQKKLLKVSLYYFINLKTKAEVDVKSDKIQNLTLKAFLLHNVVKILAKAEKCSVKPLSFL